MTHQIDQIGNWSIQEIDKELEGMNAEQLFKTMAECTSIGVRAIVKGARAYHKLREMGHDPDLPRGLRLAFERLGRGDLHPNAWAKFNSTYVGRYIHKLPMEDQKALAEGKPVTVYSFDNGQVSHRKVDIEMLVYEEQKQVLGPNGLRSKAEQRSYLEDKKAKQMDCQNATSSSPPIEVAKGKRKRGVYIRPHNDEMFISHEELARYAADTA